MGFRRLSWIIVVVLFLTFTSLTGICVEGAQRLPDLLVVDIRLVEECGIVVTIKNGGSGGVAKGAYHPTEGPVFQMYKDGLPWGGLRLAGVDPDRELMTPGATIDHLWFPRSSNLKLEPGIHTLKLSVDYNEVLSESNERNNVKEKRVSCESSVSELPDLIIEDIYLKEDCQVAVKVKNEGPGPVPSEVWTVHKPESSSVYLYRDGMRWGGKTIWEFDPGRSLQSVGGTAIYVSSLGVSKTTEITAVVDHTKQVEELDEGNNKKTKRVSCEPQPSERVALLFADAGQKPGVIYSYEPTTATENTLYNRSSGRIHSLSVLKQAQGELLYFVDANDNHIYLKELSAPSLEQVVHIHETYVRDLFVKKDGTIFFSEATGASEDGKIWRRGKDGDLRLFYKVKLSAVDGYWAGNFTFDEDGTLYLSSGNRTPASIYKVDQATDRVTKIFTDRSEPIRGLSFNFEGDGLLYYANWGEKIYRLDSISGDRSVVYSNPNRKWLSDVSFKRSSKSTDVREYN